MTIKQYEKLKIGDLVTKTSGPNKGVIMKVTNKYLAGSFDNPTPCLSAEGIDGSQYVYHQFKPARDGKHTCGAASCFRVLYD